jgi:hypothetical protein
MNFKSIFIYLLEKEKENLCMQMDLHTKENTKMIRGIKIKILLRFIK